jgi:septum site-determining protein MinC
MSHKQTPFFELRSGVVDTLLFVVKTPDLDAVAAELERRFEATPEFFAGETVALDVRRLEQGVAVDVGALVQVLQRFRMRPVAVIAHETQHDWALAGGLPQVESRERRGAQPAAAPSPETAAPAQAAVERIVEVPRSAMVVDRPLRSGQQVFARGDLIVLGMVNHGAELIAEGNIHIYAPLRGRALAGVHGNHEARIFCTCFEPELISIAGIYRTTENPLPAELLGHAVQIALRDEKLIIEPLKLN